MQFKSYLSVFAISVWLLLGCKKNAYRGQPVASLRVVNAVIDGGSVKLNASQRDSVLAYNSKSIGLGIVNNIVSIQVEPTIGSNKSYFYTEVSANEGDVFSLYLFGQPGMIESMMIKEVLPAWYSDSVMGVRVANLSPDNRTFNVALKNEPAVPIFKDVNYKTVSDFIEIPLPSIIPSGGTSFEFRDAWDSKLLATYNLPVNPSQLYPGISISLQRFKNITLVIKGSRDTLSGPNKLGVFAAAVSY